MREAIEITRLERSAAELQETAVKTEDGDVVRRLLGIALLLNDQSRREAATASGMDRQTQRDWAHRYNTADGVSVRGNIAMDANVWRLSAGDPFHQCSRAVMLRGGGEHAATMRHDMARWAYDHVRLCLRFYRRRLD